MALTTGPNLGLLVNGALGEAHYAELMRQWRGFDLLIQCTVISRSTATPPGSPADGDSYIVGPSPTGVWSGHSGHFARWSSIAAAWEFVAPKTGWTAFIQDDGARVTYTGSAWAQLEATLLVPVNTQSGTTYTFALSDTIGRVVRFTSNSIVTSIIPVYSTLPLPVGSIITGRQVGNGQVNITGESASVTINPPNGVFNRTAKRGSVFMLHHVATNEWDLTGDLEVV